MRTQIDLLTVFDRICCQSVSVPNILFIDMKIVQKNIVYLSMYFYNEIKICKQVNKNKILIPKVNSIKNVDAF